MKTSLWMILASSFLSSAMTLAADLKTAPRPQGPAAPAQPPQQQYYDEEDGPDAEGPIGPEAVAPQAPPVAYGYQQTLPPDAYGYGREIEYFYDMSLPLYTEYIYYPCDFDAYACDDIIYDDYGYPRFPYPIRQSPRFNIHTWYSNYGPYIRSIPYRADGRFMGRNGYRVNPQFYSGDPRLRSGYVPRVAPNGYVPRVVPQGNYVPRVMPQGNYVPRGIPPQGVHPPRHFGRGPF